MDASSLLMSSMRREIRLSALTNFAVQFSTQSTSPWPKCLDRSIGTHLSKQDSAMWFSNLHVSRNIGNALCYVLSLFVEQCWIDRVVLSRAHYAE